MCTALSLTIPSASPAAHLFGRTLDVERPYGAQIAVVPRRCPLPFRHAPAMTAHHAFIGAAVCQSGFPLCFDAANEHGLCMAALHFPGYAAYHAPQPDRLCLAPFEVIPYVLARCKTAAQARALLAQATVTDDPFSRNMPNTPLHWLVADAAACFAAEPMAHGLALTDNPARTLTNSPPLDYHLTRLADFMALSPAAPDNRFAPSVPLAPYSFGMGAMGLPGDLSSSSRFVRAAFLARHSALPAHLPAHGAAPAPAAPHTPPAPDPGCTPASVLHFFHLLASVSQPCGATLLPSGVPEYTHYASCFDPLSCVYYYRTYDSAQLCAVRLHDHALDGDALLAASMLSPGAALIARAERVSPPPAPAP